MGANSTYKMPPCQNRFSSLNHEKNHPENAENSKIPESSQEGYRTSGLGFFI